MKIHCSILAEDAIKAAVQDYKARHVANPVANECFRVVEGGEVVDVIETDNRCFACMLGGPDRRTLFMLTSQYSLEVEAAPRRTGNVLIADVATPGAGLP